MPQNLISHEIYYNSSYNNLVKVKMPVEVPQSLHSSQYKRRENFYIHRYSTDQCKSFTATVAVLLSSNHTLLAINPCILIYSVEDNSTSTSSLWNLGSFSVLVFESTSSWWVGQSSTKSLCVMLSCFRNVVLTPISCRVADISKDCTLFETHKIKYQITCLALVFKPHTQ